MSIEDDADVMVPAASEGIVNCHCSVYLLNPDSLQLVAPRPQIPCLGHDDYNDSAALQADGSKDEVRPAEILHQSMPSMR